MAAGKWNMQKASGGVASITVADGIGATNIVLPESGTVATTAYVDGKMVRAMAVNSTSGTSIDFTGIPSWAKRITVMFNGVSTNGGSSNLVQIGSGSIQTTGYSSASGGFINNTVPSVTASTAGIILLSDTATDVRSGHITITLVSGFTYTSSHTIGCNTLRNVVFLGGGNITLSGVLDRVRITTVNGTDTFDAGQINIMYEG